MHISDEMIDPELRKTGKVIRTVLPYFTPTTIKIMNKLTDTQRGITHTNVNYEQHFITRPDGSKLRVCVYYPKTLKKNAPGVLWIHGGGYTTEIPEVEESAFIKLIDSAGTVVVAPDYQTAAIKPYPAALNDCHLGLKWLKDHSAEYQVRFQIS